MLFHSKNMRLGNTSNKMASQKWIDPGPNRTHYRIFLPKFLKSEKGIPISIPSNFQPR